MLMVRRVDNPPDHHTSIFFISGAVLTGSTAPVSHHHKRYVKQDG